MQLLKISMAIEQFLNGSIRLFWKATSVKLKIPEHVEEQMLQRQGESNANSN